MKLRRALFQAPEPGENDGDGPRTRTTKSAPSAAPPFMDSLAFVGQPSAPRIKEPVFSILEQLDNLNLHNRPQQSRQEPCKPQITKDPYVIDSLGAVCTVGGPEPRAIKPTASKSDTLQALNQTKQFAQSNHADSRKLVTAKHPHRPGATRRMTRLKSTGGILGNLTPPKQSGNVNNNVKHVGNAKLERPLEKLPSVMSVLEGETGLRRVVSSPILSPSYKSNQKRFNQQSTPSEDTKMTGFFSGCNDPTTREETADGYAPAMSLQPCRLQAEVDTTSSLESVSNEAASLPRQLLETDNPLAPCSNKDPPIANALVTDRASATYDLLARASTRDGNVTDNLRDNVNYLIPPPSSPDPIIDRASLRKLEKEESIKRMLQMDVVLGESISVSSCSLTAAIHDESDDDTSVMAIASFDGPHQTKETGGLVPEIYLDRGDASAVIDLTARSRTRSAYPDRSHASQCKKMPQRQQKGRIQREQDSLTIAQKLNEQETRPSELSNRPRRIRKPTDHYRPGDHTSKSVDKAFHASVAGEPLQASKRSSKPVTRRDRPKTVEETSGSAIETGAQLIELFWRVGGDEEKTIDDHLCPRRLGSPAEEEGNDWAQDWTNAQLQQLSEAQRSTDPSSMTFWEDVAAQVTGKNASECSARWMKMFPTPAPNHVSRRGAPRQNFDALKDDLFDATPWRDKERELRLPNELAVRSAIKLEAATVGTQVTEDYEGGHGWKPRAGMGKYVQDMNRAARQPRQKGKGRGYGDMHENAFRERIDTDGINMDVRMTPGGTLDFRCLRDDNEDDFFDEYYGSVEESKSL